MKKSNNSEEPVPNSDLSEEEKKSKETKPLVDSRSKFSSIVKSFREDEENPKQSDVNTENQGSEVNTERDEEEEEEEELAIARHRKSSESSSDINDDDDDEEEEYEDDTNSSQNLNQEEEVDTKNLLKHNFGNTDKNFLSEGNSSLKQTQLSKQSRKKTGIVRAARAVYMNTTVNCPVICRLKSYSDLWIISDINDIGINCLSLYVVLSYLPTNL